MTASTRMYKGYIIKKITKGNIRCGYHLEYYTINDKGMYLYLKDAKAEVDKLIA